jgi:uncharacterized protein
LTRLTAGVCFAARRSRRIVRPDTDVSLEDRMAKFVMETAKSGQIYWNLVAGNNEKTLHSEMYESKASAKNGAESVKKNSADRKRFTKGKNSKGQYWFEISATNAEIIGKSQMYASEDTCDAGIASVMRDAPSATIEDNT